MRTMLWTILPGASALVITHISGALVSCASRQACPEALRERRGDISPALQRGVRDGRRQPRFFFCCEPRGGRLELRCVASVAPRGGSAFPALKRGACFTASLSQSLGTSLPGRARVHSSRDVGNDKHNPLGWARCGSWGPLRPAGRATRPGGSIIGGYGAVEKPVHSFGSSREAHGGAEVAPPT